MAVLASFEEEDGKYKIFKLKDGEVENLISQAKAEFELCFITPEKAQVALENGVFPEDFINAVLPDDPSIMSGDFSEILSYLMLPEIHGDLTLDGIRKWRWKEDRNRSALKSDVLKISHQTGSPPRATDYLIAAEVKGKATYSTKCKVSEAVNGANEDALGRMVKTLNWMKDKALTDGKMDLANRLDRYRNPSQKGTYKKHFRAIVVGDPDALDIELESNVELPEIEDSFDVLIISLPEMKVIYEKMYETIKEEFIGKNGQNTQ